MRVHATIQTSVVLLTVLAVYNTHTHTPIIQIIIMCVLCSTRDDLTIMRMCACVPFVVSFSFVVVVLKMCVVHWRSETEMIYIMTIMCATELTTWTQRIVSRSDARRRHRLVK